MDLGKEPIPNLIGLLRRSISREYQEGPLLKGSFRKIYRACGKAACKCSSNRRSDLHGPYIQYVYYADGRLKTDIPKGEAEASIRQAIARERRVEEYSRALMILERARILGYGLESLRTTWASEYRQVERVMAGLSRRRAPTRSGKRPI